MEKVKTDQRTRALETICVGAFAPFSPLRDVVGCISLRDAFSDEAAAEEEAAAAAAAAAKARAAAAKAMAAAGTLRTAVAGGGYAMLRTRGSTNIDVHGNVMGRVPGVSGGAPLRFSEWAEDPMARTGWERMRMVYPFLQVRRTATPLHAHRTRPLPFGPETPSKCSRFSRVRLW